MMYDDDGDDDDDNDNDDDDGDEDAYESTVCLGNKAAEAPPSFDSKCKAKGHCVHFSPGVKRNGRLFV